LTVLKTREIIASLTSKGFVRSNTDHAFLILYVGEKKTSIRTKVSFGQREIGDDLIAKMSRQTKLKKKLFLELIDCQLTADGYLEELRKSGQF